jgi:hypothetical protein
VEREPLRLLVLRHRGAGEERLPPLVEVANLRLLQRPEPKPGPVDDEVRQQVLARKHAGDRLDVAGQRHDQVALALVRELVLLVGWWLGGDCRIGRTMPFDEIEQTL